jgi:glycosyltransferase involved in cell wall biosynthesis
VNIYLAGYQALSILHGGPLTQLRETAAGLNALGWDTRLFDPWAPFTPQQGDLMHLFAANIGTYHLAREIHALGLPLVVSPIIYTRHSATFARNALRLSRLAQRIGPGVWTDYAICADICGWASRVIPNTGAEAEFMINGIGVPREKVTVVPNGVEERFSKATPDLFVQKYGLKNFILTVGHTGHVRKNVLRLIQALGGIDHPAVIMGRIIKGAYGDACVREAAKHKHILLIDGVSHDSDLLASAYAACEVFALPSLFETPGIAALEAGLAGAKIVITKYGGTQEYFDAMATYVEPASVESIREGIIAALKQPKGTSLQMHIKAKYLWGEVARQTAEVYRQVVSTSPC